MELMTKIIPLKLFLDQFRVWKSQGQEIANLVTQILLTWTAQEASQTYTDTRGNIIRVRTGYHLWK